MKPFLKKNECFFSFLGRKKYKVFSKSGIMVNDVTFLMFSQKISISPFPVKFSILVKSKVAAKVVATFDDVTGPPAAPHPIMYVSSCRAHHRLSTKGENFPKYCNITKTQVGGGGGGGGGGGFPSSKTSVFCFVVRISSAPNILINMFLNQSFMIRKFFVSVQSLYGKIPVINPLGYRHTQMQTTTTTTTKHNPVISPPSYKPILTFLWSTEYSTEQMFLFSNIFFNAIKVNS